MIGRFLADFLDKILLKGGAIGNKIIFMALCCMFWGRSEGRPQSI